MQILAATDLSTRSHRALRRAGLLAQANDAELTLVHVVDDDQPADLVEIEIREVERILTEQIGAVTELNGVHCRPAVIAGDAFNGVLRTAESTRADLIVMGAHRKQLLLDIFVGTTIERVIRMGRYPVLMVNDTVERPYETALAAVDMPSLPWRKERCLSPDSKKRALRNTWPRSAYGLPRTLPHSWKRTNSAIRTGHDAPRRAGLLR
jgi:universal stress protein E